ncbi:DUF1707 SHOCT-like domain-containing protein [Streptomyces clavuligerus]|uniref:DUF1707 multi-domain protein n=1 Tax=Streptomyces clavuligerus TaxID=1901 RepID=B5GTU4_STRCL|nr:DUF1707 domain-containing protein [Streptomyces clavuligerus]ANW18354.1 hypothetical protein BB341_08990 [Streptomyces clavuligerus]AXU12911.1 DUF1707 and DUF2154 domain-containing protein [Streptomyces clavuligerus]EDY49740.1 conserved hypothetical protein [Streptomyces clavuligerus]EFG09023.1 DUF1707 multi-domain protein [Streptomyces clavuligerus]MBY6302835.1 DUF1707 and DUF2154 domain-containing protein [Streptomyces clavuligerus]
MDLEKQPQKPAFPADSGTAVPAAAPVPGAADTLRASDADRDRIADILREALAEGRLDAEEHSERIDAVYRAKTMGELQPLIQDLPAARTADRSTGPVGGQVPPGPAEHLVAVFSSSIRKGRWRVGRRTHAFAVFGSVEIDLTEALFEQRHTVINATAIFGNVEVRVPENITLRGNGSGIFGNFEVRTLESVEPDAPVVTVHGYTVFGNVEAKPKRGRRVADLQDRMRKYFLG